MSAHSQNGVPRSDGTVLHVDAENYADPFVNLLNAGVRWLGEPSVPGSFGTTEVTDGFAYGGRRALHARTTQTKQRAQIKLAKRFDAPASTGTLIMEFVFRPVRSKSVRLSNWIIWRGLSTVGPGPFSVKQETPVSIELRALGSAATGTYSVDVVEGRGTKSTVHRRAVTGLKQNRWMRFIMLREPVARTVRLWVGTPDREQFVGTFADRRCNEPVDCVLLGDDSTKANVGSGYWDDIRIGQQLRRRSDLRPGEPSPILRFAKPEPATPIAVTHRRHLFIDDWVIDQCRDVKRTPHSIQKHPANPVIVPEHPWEGAAVLGGGGVFRDEESGELRLYYKAYNPRLGPGPKYRRLMKRSFTCIATSHDGIHWKKPHVGLFTYKRSKKNNIVIAATGQLSDEEEMFEPPATVRGIRAANSILHQPDEPDPQRRYMALVRTRGFSLLTSPDGIRWTDCGKIFDQGYDCTTIAYDPVRKIYYANSKMGAWGRRGRGHMESPDCLHWSDAQYQMTVDQRDRPNDQMYTMDMWYYETLHLAFLRVYHVEPEHRLDLQLISARDPRHWDRTFRSALIELGDQRSNEWDWANQSVISVPPVVVGDQMWIYYSGRTQDHRSRDYLGNPMPRVGQPWGRIGFGTLRLDGFVSANAGSALGTLATKPLSLVNDKLWVNADARGGELRVELTDAGGRVLKGYSREDCVPLTRDAVRQQVRFKHRRALPDSSQAVRIRFFMHDVSLYAFWTK